MRRRWAVLLVVVFACGCGGGNELGARYRLERRYYEARELERDAYATYPRDSYIGWLIAVDAYRNVLRSNPARIPESADWNASRVAEMEHIALAAEVGLLRLELVDYRFHDAVTHGHRSTGDRPEILGTVRFASANELYDSLGTDPFGERCVRRLRSVSSNPALWTGTQLLRDSLLAAPAALLHHTPAAASFAEGFYSRVISEWPDSACAARARDYRARVRMAVGDFAGALADVEAASLDHPDARRREALFLARCDLLAFELGRVEEAVEILRGAVAQDPAGMLAWQARTRLAILAPPPDETAAERLRVIHMDTRAPPEVAASAMFARAYMLEAAGHFREASDLYWRLTQRHPSSEAALAAPLRVLRREAADSRGGEAARSLARARTYYLDVLGRGSAAVEPRFLPLDCLVEAHLILDDPAGAADALREALSTVSSESSLVVRLKLAAVMGRFLGRPEKSVDILEKALVLDSGSRYARCVRWKLERIREAQSAQSG